MSPPRAVRLGVLVCAAVALLAVALVALPARAQNPEVTATPAATGTDPPAKPMNLQATAEHDHVTLTWTASVDPTVTHYAILRRDRNTDALGVFHVIEPNAGAGTSYTDNSVAASGSYVYRAKSVSPTGVSKWSGYRRADTPPAPPPPTPTSTLAPPATTTTQPPVPAPPPPAPPPTTTTQPPTIGTATIERSAPKPPPPNPDPDIFLPSTQGDPPLVPRAQVVTQTDQDADTIVPLDWALKPSGLVAEDKFRLLFTTHTGRAPTSTDIADYNTYIQSQANAGSAHSAIKPYASGFRVVGSTAADDARDNTSTPYTDDAPGVPIYWLNGNKVADDYQDFYDGTWANENTPTRRDGAVRFPSGGFVWTGSRTDGTAHATTPFGANSVEAGRLNGAGGPLNASGSFANTGTGAPYYALSEVFTVAGTNICGRTPPVVEAILAATPAADTCGTVSTAELAAIVELAPSGSGHYHLQSDDFAGLTTLTRLDLTGMNVTGLPADGFTGIEDLLELDLSGSGLRQLAAGDFDGLPTLSVLDLSDNLISDLPTGVFDGLTRLIELDLSDTRLLSGLSRDTFADLGNLQIFRIANTSQEHRTGETGFRGDIIFSEGFIVGYDPILPGDFFEHLTSLRELDMRPTSPLLAAPLSLVPLTDLETYNGEPYTRPAAPPRNLTATISDIDRSWMVRGTSFCKSVRLTWAAPAGVTGITGYKIRRTHYGHPVRETGRGNLQGGHRFVRHTEDFGRYGYDIATVGAGTTGYTHKPLRPGAAGHKFTYYVAAVTDNGVVGFPAVVKVEADVLLKWASIGSATTGPDVLDCPMRW